MDVEDGLPGIPIGVEDDPIPALDDPLEFGNLTSGRNDITQQLRIRGGKLRNIPVPLPGHNEHVNPSLRPNIPKRKGGLILIHDISRDLPTNDPFEESLSIITAHASTLPRAAFTHRPPTKLAGSGACPGWGSGGLTPRKHNETKPRLDSERSEQRDAAVAVKPGGRLTATAAAAGPRGEVPGGVCVFPVAHLNFGWRVNRRE